KSPADQVHQKQQGGSRKQVKDSALGQSPAEYLEEARKHHVVDGPERVPGIFDIAAEVTVHWPGKLAPVQDFIRHLGDHGFVAVIWDRKGADSLAGYSDKSGEQGRDQYEVADLLERPARRYAGSCFGFGRIDHVVAVNNA